MDDEKNILRTPRLSLIEQVNSAFKSVRSETEVARMKANARSIIASAVMVSAGIMVGGGVMRHRQDIQTIAKLTDTVANRDLSLAQATITHLATELTHVSSASRENQTAIQASLLQLTEVLGQIHATERTTNHYAQQISPANRTLHNQLQRVQGQVIALRLRLDTTKVRLESDAQSLHQIEQTRTNLIHTNPLAAAMSDLQAQALPCQHDAVQAACTGPLHGITCYAFLAGSDDRSNCEAIKPICTRCNLR